MQKPPTHAFHAVLCPFDNLGWEDELPNEDQLRQCRTIITTLPEENAVRMVWTVKPAA